MNARKTYKEEIIQTIENLPAEIDGYKLFIYESRNLEPWGLICNQGKLDKKKLLDIFNYDNEIRHYDFNPILEYQFAVIYEKNEHLLFDKTFTGSLTDCLLAVLTKIKEYKNKPACP